jgi:transcription elongation factor Elf1
VRVPSRATSRPGRIVCPACGSGELQFRRPTLLRFRGPVLAECDSCGRDVDRAILRVLEQIVALPEAIGLHACECGHPEMRRLPDGAFRCPACGAEVLPFEAFRGRRPAPGAGAPSPGGGLRVFEILSGFVEELLQRGGCREPCR